MQKLWTIVFVILMPDIVRSMNLTNSNNTKNTVLISKTHNMELNMMYNAENITELNTVQNTILNNTSIENENRTQYENKVLPKKYIVMQEMYRKERKRRMVTQAVIQGALLIVLLLILIIMAIKNDYIKYIYKYSSTFSTRRNHR